MSLNGEKLTQQDCSEAKATIRLNCSGLKADLSCAQKSSIQPCILQKKPKQTNTIVLIHLDLLQPQLENCSIT